jgi:hypothetical protein
MHVAAARFVLSHVFTDCNTAVRFTSIQRNPEGWHSEETNVY